ncbi:MAG: helix-turn-helix domain-containing protein [Aurantibacter sp.]
MTYNIGALLSFLVAFQLFFLALYLFTHKKGNKRNNMLLALLFLLFAINLMDFAARVSGIIFPIPLLHLLDDCFFFLYGPVLSFSPQGVVYRDFAFKKSDAWNLVPCIGVTSYLMFHVLFVDLETQSEVAKTIISADFPAWVSATSLVIYLHILCYLWFSWRTIKNYQSIIKDKFSSIDQINLDWLSFMIRAFSGITIVAMISNIIPVFGSKFYLYASVMVLLISSFYFINLVLVKALNQPAIFSGIAKEETERYAMSNLGSDEIENYKNQLSNLMQANRLYLNADLKSKDLAEKLDISPKVLSQVINQSFNQNFFDFINTFRCEEVKRILQGPDKKITIIEAMYQSGFNSKSSFNKEFKKLTGQTPSEFKKSLPHIHSSH